MEHRGGKCGQGWEGTGTKAAQEEGIGRRRLTRRGRVCPRWCSLSLPLGCRHPSAGDSRRIAAHRPLLVPRASTGSRQRWLPRAPPASPRGRFRVPAEAEPSARASAGRDRRRGRALLGARAGSWAAGSGRVRAGLRRRVHDLDLRPELRRIGEHAIRSTIIGCPSDELVTPAHAREIARLLRGEYREYSSQNGHIWPITDPEGLIASLRPIRRHALVRVSS